MWIATVSRSFLKPSLERSVSSKQQPQGFADSIRFGRINKLSVLVELRFDLLLAMLVQGAHYILGPFGEDSELQRWGLKLAARGGKNAKKRAVVAVARKLAVLLHRLWVSGEVYEPLRNSHQAMRAVA